MAVLEITSRQFRERQKSFFDLADSGQKIIIKRGNKQAYTIIPINEDDLYFTPEMLARIEESRQQALEGKVTRVSGFKELDRFLDSL